MSETLGPMVAGIWYPAEREELLSRLERLERAAPAEEAAGRTAALIAPHAGYDYSGEVAARVFGGLRRSGRDRVLLLGPSHYHAFDGCALTRARRYRTPLGDVALDAPAAERLAGRAGFRAGDGPFEREHSLEAEVPFLQRLMGSDFRLLPLLIGAGTSTTLERIAGALHEFVDERTLIVASSDFTHFGPRFGYVPFESDVPAGIERLDRGAFESILACDRTGFAEYCRRTGATICGRAAIDLLLRLLPPGAGGSLVAYDTSGRITGDWANSVSYAGLSFRGPQGAGAA